MVRKVKEENLKICKQLAASSLPEAATGKWQLSQLILK